MKIETLVKLPWTWLGPQKVTEEGMTYWVSTIAELDGFVVAGETLEEVERDRRNALEEFLLSYLEQDQIPPLPGWKLTMPGSADATARPFDFASVDATVSNLDPQLA